MLKLNKKSVRIISVIVLAIIMFVFMGTQVYALELPNVTPESPGDQANDLASVILNTMMWVGVMISVGMLIFLGIKYVTASPDGKADLKKQLGVYVLGFVLIVAATTIVGILANALGK